MKLSLLKTVDLKTKSAIPNSFCRVIEIGFFAFLERSYFLDLLLFTWTCNHEII